MSAAASRSRLLELRGQLEAAARGREVLERKRELLLFEIRRRAGPLVVARRGLASSLAAARAALAVARVELGSPLVDAAALAQPPTTSVELRAASILGVPVPRLVAPPASTRPAYGPAGTSASLDRAVADFCALVPELARLAELEAASAALRRGLRKTARRLSALERVVIPRLEADLRAVAGGLEEEERDEALRLRAWLGRAR